MKKIAKAALLAIISTAAVIAGVPSYGQDVLESEKIKGLKNLRAIALVVQPNTPKEVFDVVEWADIMEVGLSQKIPELGRLDDVEKASAWLQLGVITTEQGGLLELSLYRWVRLEDTGEVVFAIVWSDFRLKLGGITESSLRESLDMLLTRFAADYYRAKR